MTARRAGTWVVALAISLAATACTPWHVKYGIKETKDLNTPEAMPGLTKAVGSDSCSDVYKASVAIYELSIEDEAAAAALDKAIRGECGEDMGYYLAQALGRTGKAGFPYLKKLANGATGNERYLAMVGIGEMKDPPPEAVSILAEKIASTKEIDEWGARAEAFTSLAKLGPKAAAALPTLFSLITDEGYAWYAVNCIGDMGHPSKKALDTLAFLAEKADSSDIRDLAEEKHKILKLKSFSAGLVDETPPPRPSPDAKTPVTKKVTSKNDIVAVFAVQDMSSKFEAKVLEQLTLYMMNQMTQKAGYRVVPRDQLKKRLAEQKADSYKKCYDESCQIELGRSLSAQKTLSTQLLQVGSKCMIVSNMFDLKTETSDKAASLETSCDIDELLGALSKVAEQYN